MVPGGRSFECAKVWQRDAHQSKGACANAGDTKNIDVPLGHVHFDSTSGSVQKGVGGLGAQNIDFPARKCTLFGALESLVKA